jgi:2-polyprenyl-6-methoxyphenol hydroxylase-like FAD-dependent oxidoreductase
VVPYEQFTAVLFCSDNRAVQTAVVPLTEDRRFRRLGDPDVYDAVLRTLPTHEQWMPALEPISPIHQMVAPHNTLRRLVADGMPVATGLLPIGDSICTTNPTFGRGLSLAAWTAADLVDVLDDHGGDPLKTALAFDERIAQHVVPYYHDQAQVDSARLAMLRHAVSGAPAPILTEMANPAVSFPELRAASLVDPVAYRAFWAVMGMLRRPQEVYNDPDLVAIVANLSAQRPAGREAAPDMAQVMAALDT